MSIPDSLPPSGKLLGLDLGTKTIGVAVSDGLRYTATPLETIAICILGTGASAVRRASPSRSELAPLPPRPARQAVPVRLRPSSKIGVNPSTTLTVTPSGNSAA